MTNDMKQTDNSIGVAGFVLSLTAIFLGWIPVFGWIIWLLGLIFSSVGLFKKPKGFSIAGFCLSIFSFIMAITFFGAILSTSI